MRLSVCLARYSWALGDSYQERKERVELCHTERDMFPRGALMRTSLDCAMGRFLGTLLLLLDTVLLVLGSLAWLLLVTMLVLLLGGFCLGVI